MREQSPENLETERLLLRRPRPDDAPAIFERYASDPEVTRFLVWPRHRTLDDTRAFIAFSDGEWERGPVGPYLIESRAGGRLLGSTGLSFETPRRASTGYVLARDAWGHGYATEALRAMRDLALRLRVVRLYALCHPRHRASWRVLEKGGFEREAVLRRHTMFPNIEDAPVWDVLCYSSIFERP